MQAIREKLKHVSRGDHAGLILSRYLREQEGSGTEAKDKAERKALYTRAIAAVKSNLFYAKAFERWKAAWKFTPGSEKPYRGSIKDFFVPRMILGLGSDNVLEAGLTLHHTYGVPYIPGSAIKGLCAHYCDEMGGEFAKEKELYRTLFGDQTQAGMIRFHDALIDPTELGKCLHPDVMTPHHMDYYGGTAEAPTEYDAPNPVTFLSVSGKFLFVISCDETDENGMVTANGRRWIDFVWKLLEGALKYKGIGGKTNSGYGFGTLREPPAPIKEPMKKGTLAALTRLTNAEAKAVGRDKKLMFKDEEGNCCIVPSKEEGEIKKLAPQPDDVVELAYDSEQKQGDRTFLMFRLPTEKQ